MRVPHSPLYTLGIDVWSEGVAEGLRCYFREVCWWVLHVKVRSLRVKVESLSCLAHVLAAARVQPHTLCFSLRQ